MPRRPGILTPCVPGGPMRAGVLAVLMMLGGSAGAAEPGPAPALRLDYQIYAGGLRAAQATVRLDLGRERYRAEVEVATHGWIGRLAPWSARSRVHGAVRDGTLRPAEYVNTSTWRGQPRSVVLDYDAAGGVAARAEPPNEADERDPVPPEVVRGTLDPVSAVVALVHGLAQARDCAGRMPVFDGRRRYDLVVRDQGTTELKGSRYARFAGTAVRCEATLEMLAGARRTPRWHQDPEASEPVAELWLAPVTPGGPPVPVRVEAPTGIGRVMVHLRDVALEPQTAEAPD